MTTERAIDKVLHALTARGSTVKQAGADRWVAQCPAHDDSTPSLSIAAGHGQALVYCHAGCTHVDIAAALGLTVPDYFDSPRGVEYRYEDEHGRLNRSVFRSPGKKFTQRVEQKGKPSPLYRLERVTKAVAAGETIYVVEGEKDAHALEAIGVTATCAPMGAGKWHKTDSSPLDGAVRVVVVADKDEPGRGHAADVVASLTGRVGALEVVEAAAGKDAADHVTAGHALHDFVPVDPSSLPTSRHEPERSERPARLKLTAASSVRTIRQRWLWQDRIPLDTPSIFAGRGGEGKTTYALHLAAQLTRGILPGEYEGTPATVIVWSGEDRAETVLVPRLQAAGADLERVRLVSGVARPDEDDTGALRFPDDVDALDAAITTTSAALVIVDPLTSTTAGDLHKVADVRRTLDALAEVTRRTGAVVLGIMHFNKGQGHAGDKLSGSHAFRDAVRSLFLFATDEETGQRIVTQEKNNYAENTAASLAFTLTSTPVDTHDGDLVHVARIDELGESDISVQDLINRGTDDEDQRQDRNEAQAWLIDFLGNRSGGEAPSGDVIKAAAKDGFSAQQVKDARRRCRDPRIVSQKASFTSGWVWSLDDSQGGSTTPQGGEGGKGGSPQGSRHLAATFTPEPDKVAKVAASHQESPPSPPSPPSSNRVPPSSVAPAILDAYRRAGGHRVDAEVTL